MGGKPLENGLLAIFEDGFSGDNPRAVMQRLDAPRWKLRCVNPWRYMLWKNGKRVAEGFFREIGAAAILEF